MCVAQHATKSLVCMWFAIYPFLQPVVKRKFLFPMRIKSFSGVTFDVSLCIENRTIKILQRIQSKSCFVQVSSGVAMHQKYLNINFIIRVSLHICL